MLEKIQKVIDEKVNTVLGLHRGGCQASEFEDGILSIFLEGACVGCPSAKLTLYNFVVPVIQNNFPEVKQVLIEEERLIDQQ